MIFQVQLCHSEEKLIQTKPQLKHCERRLTHLRVKAQLEKYAKALPDGSPVRCAVRLITLRFTAQKPCQT